MKRRKPQSPENPVVSDDKPLHPQLEAARSIAKASLAAGFPVPAQFVEHLGLEAGVAALEAEVAVELQAQAAAAAPTDQNEEG